MTVKNEDVLTLELTVEEVNTVLTALSKQPLESVIGIWAKIKQDAEAQLSVLNAESTEE